ncbi:MAG: GtrA family protein [Acidimicrobiales bacterium]
MRAQIARFVVVGGSNAVIDFALFEIFILVHPTRDPDTLVAYNTVAVICALANSYRWNRSWTFRGSHASAGRALWRERLLFLAQSVLNLAVNDLALAGITVLLNRNHLLAHDTTAANNIAKFVGVLVASTTSFVAMRLVVFRAGRTRC